MTLGSQFEENDVDYRVRPSSVPAKRFQPWQMILFALLVIVILASFFIIIISIQANEISDQEEVIVALCVKLQEFVDPLPQQCPP